MPCLAFLAPLALALACALAPAARASEVQPRIVGGGPSGSIPYQVAVFNGGGFCGGVVYDASTVITAAHCVVDLGSKNLSATPDVHVVAGTSSLASLGTDGVVVDAKALSVDPAYNPDTNDHDIAKIELASPLWTTLTPPPAIQPIGIVNDASFQSLLDNLDTTPVTATVSGWGCTDPVAPGSDTCPGTLPDDLQSVDIPLIKQADCSTDYGAVGVTITSNMFCAGVAGSDVSTNKDSCFGDSGGPLTIDDPDNTGHPALAGLVDSGNGCAQDTFPGIYTRVSALTDFVTATDPAPGATAPSLSGTPGVGQTLTCNPGDWSGAPTFRYRFFRHTGSGSISSLSSYSSSSTFTVPSFAGGSNVFCQVEATGTNAVRVADSADLAIPVPPPPPPVKPPPPPPPPPAVDSTAPKLRIVSKRCTRTSCTVKVHVADASPSSGIGTLRATLGWSKRVKCRARKGRRSNRPGRTCTKRVRKSLRPKAGSNGNFTIVAKRLQPGTGYTLTLVPFDRAGNRPQFSTITNVRTRSRHSSGLLL